MWPQYKGRDGCRTPMPWAAQQAHAGFTTADKPWLPVAPAHLALAVDRQQADPSSTLAYFTQLLHWRRKQPALCQGSMTLLPPHPQVLAFQRSVPQQRVLCVFNFSDQPANWPMPAGWETAQTLNGSGLTGAQLDGTTLQLDAWGGAFLHL
jgi:alpha-glucosidase